MSSKLHFLAVYLTGIEKTQDYVATIQCNLQPEKEESKMQCYKTYAATILIANMFETLSDTRRKLPLAEIADWMAQNDLEPEDVLFGEPDVVKANLTEQFDKINYRSRSTTIAA